MIWPQQRNPQPTREATAPYNFVPLPSAVFLPASTSATERADHLPWSAERHHGVIRLTIRTETPLFTPCAERTAEVTEPDGTGSAAGDFYHHGDPARPVLPGSSLRGMIRALVAVISHARITRRRRDGRPAGIVDERLFYRGAGDGPSKLDQRYRDLFIRRRPDGAYESPARSVRAGYLRQAGASWAI